ncbi:hypothetical protein [Brachyspira pilosicoli]|uniref:hypothetical protein n=1 Tax=Brachyspira pilosicoli TaxID=52584 RepID=UPI0030045267
MKIYTLLLLTLFVISACTTLPKKNISNEAAQMWIEKSKNKIVMDNFQNIYRFDKHSNIDIIIYGYSNPTKYNLLKMSEKNKAVYYTKTKRQNFILSSLPRFNLYNLLETKKVYDPMYLTVDFNYNGNFKNNTIYRYKGFVIENGNLYIANDYNKYYMEKLENWLNKNGYGKDSYWKPYNSANWNEYPIPTEDDINWDNVFLLGKLEK